MFSGFQNLSEETYLFSPQKEYIHSLRKNANI